MQARGHINARMDPIAASKPISVIRNGVKQAMWMLLLLYLQDSVNVLINVIRGFNLLDIISIAIASKNETNRRTYCHGQVEHCLARYECFFMIVLDFHIDDMYNTVEFTPS